MVTEPGLACRGWCAGGGVHLQLLAFGHGAQPLPQATHEGLGDDQLVGQRGVADHSVVELAVDGDGEVGRYGPGRGRPDRDAHLAAVDERRERGGGLAHCEGGIDTLGDVVLGILELRLGQRGAAARAPVHGLAAAEDVSVEHLVRVRVRVKGER